MQETHRIADQLNRSFRGQAWHGPALEELLHDVPFDRAAVRPLPGTHSVWEIVLHVTAWLEAVRRLLQRQPIELSPEHDWPEIGEESDAAWQIALGNLEGAHEMLRGAIAALDPNRLDDRVTGKPYSVYFMLHGVIEHNVYHAGQIALLKKA